MRKAQNIDQNAGISADLYADFLRYPTIFTVKATPSSGIVSQFYDLPEDSVDVLFLGSCNIYNKRQYRYVVEEYGISAYNFATSDQSMYFLLFFEKRTVPASAQASGNRCADVD